MPYYPKSQIKTNQYSDGTLFVLTSGVIYTGYYYQTSDGRYFSGKTPQDLPQIELTDSTNQNTVGAPFQRNPLFDSQFTEYDITSPYQTFGEYDSSVYPKYNTDFFKPTPVYITSKPTPEEYKIGEFRRYFLKKTNQIQYIEVDKNTFTSIAKKEPIYDWTLYYPFFLSWQLTGNKEKVAEVNKNITLLAMKNQRLPNLDEYLQFNWTKYYQFPNISNLYTAGGEFKTANGKNYIGFYHIYDKTGPMVGDVHTKTSHGLLFPINETIISQVITQQQPQVTTQTTSSYTPPTTTTGGGFSGGGGGGFSGGGGGGY